MRIRYLLLASLLFLGLWIVCLGAISALNPMVIGAFQQNPALLRFTIELETLVSVVVPTVICIKVFKSHPQLAGLACTGVSLKGGRVSSRRGRFGNSISSPEKNEALEVSAQTETSGAYEVETSLEKHPMHSDCAECSQAYSGGKYSKTKVRAVCVAAVLAVVGGALWFFAAFGALIASGFASVASITVPDGIVLWGIALVANAAFQELLCRGYLFSSIANYKGFVWATVVTTALFTLFHVNAFVCGPLAVANIMLMSVFLSVLRWYSRGLTVPIVVHAVWNLLGGLGFGVVVLADDYPCMAQTVMMGPSWVSGGSMGLEGSVAALAVTAVFLAVFVVIMRKRHIEN